MRCAVKERTDAPVPRSTPGAAAFVAPRPPRPKASSSSSPSPSPSPQRCFRRCCCCDGTTNVATCPCSALPVLAGIDAVAPCRLCLRKREPLCSGPLLSANVRLDGTRSPSTAAAVAALLRDSTPAAVLPRSACCCCWCLRVGLGLRESAANASCSFKQKKRNNKSKRRKERKKQQQQQDKERCQWCSATRTWVQQSNSAHPHTPRTHNTTQHNTTQHNTTQHKRVPLPVSSKYCATREPSSCCLRNCRAVSLPCKNCSLAASASNDTCVGLAPNCSCLLPAVACGVCQLSFTCCCGGCGGCGVLGVNAGAIVR